MLRDIRCPNCRRIILLKLDDCSNAVIEVKCRNCKRTIKIAQNSGETHCEIK